MQGILKSFYSAPTLPSKTTWIVHRQLRDVAAREGYNESSGVKKYLMADQHGDLYQSEKDMGKN